jgi:hypothetical protein
MVSLFESQAVRDQRSLGNTDIHDNYFRVFARRSHFLVLKFSRVSTFSVLALANAGPYCDPGGGSLSVRCRAKKGLTFWDINVSLDGKLKQFIVYHSYLLLIKHLVKHINTLRTGDANLRLCVFALQL